MGFGRCFGPSRTKDDGPPRALPPTLGQSHPVIGLVFVCVGAPCIPACAVLLTPNIVMMETYRMRRCGDESLHEHNQNTRCRGSNKPLAEPQTMKAATYCRHTGPATQCSAALPPGCQYFSYRELEDATGGWARSNIIGDGGFGRVYRGCLRSGRLVAVKRLDRHGMQARACTCRRAPGTPPKYPTTHAAEERACL